MIAGKDLTLRGQSCTSGPPSKSENIYGTHPSPLRNIAIISNLFGRLNHYRSNKFTLIRGASELSFANAATEARLLGRADLDGGGRGRRAVAGEFCAGDVCNCVHVYILILFREIGSRWQLVLEIGRFEHRVCWT
jgi:hypothetical protein